MTIGAGGYGCLQIQIHHMAINNTPNKFDTHITPPTSPTTYNLRAYGGGAGGSYQDIILIPVVLFQILLAVVLVVLVDLVVEHTHTKMFPALNHQFPLVVLVLVDRDILEVVIHFINHLEMVL